MSGILPPNWPIADKDGKITRPWYGYLKEADDTWRTMVVTGTSVTSTPGSLISNNGIALLAHVPGSTNTLEAPILGCRKTICVVSTSTTAKVALASTTHAFRNQSTAAGSTGWYLNFGSSAPYKAVELLGISTSEYLIVSNIGSVTVSTA
jgi:hypothetical protein